MRNDVLVYAEAVDVAAEGAVWYARRIGGGAFAALHVPGRHTDSGINARWFDLTGGEPRLEIAPAGSDPTQAVLAAVAAHHAGGADVVTIVIPEQYRKRSLLSAARGPRLRLKLRLLVEPHVAVAVVPAVTSQRRPEGKVPASLAVRLLATQLDAAALRGAEYARALGADDLRAVGPVPDPDGRLGLELDELPGGARLGDAVVDYLRTTTSEPTSAVNLVLPERIDVALPRLRSTEALALKRILLFEPRVILTSVPHRGAAGAPQ